MCVISLEEINVTPETVPYSQCREVRTVTAATSNMDKITIAASAAICGTIIVAVVVFVATSRRRSRKMHDLHKQKMGCGHPVTGLPINCCTSPTSPGGPVSQFATLNAFGPHKVSTANGNRAVYCYVHVREWDITFNRNGTKCRPTVPTASSGLRSIRWTNPRPSRTGSALISGAKATLSDPWPTANHNTASPTARIVTSPDSPRISSRKVINEPTFTRNITAKLQLLLLSLLLLVIIN